MPVGEAMMAACWPIICCVTAPNAAEAMKRFWHIVVGFFAIIGVLVFLCATAGIGVAIYVQSRTPHVGDSTVLTLDLTQSYPDQAPDSGIQRLLYPNRLTLIDVLDTTRACR